MTAYDIFHSESFIEAHFMKSITLFLMAVIPAAALCVYIYKKDRTDKEPVSLLLKLFLLGALITVPTSIIEGITEPVIRGIFSAYGDVSSMPFIIYIFYQFIYNTFGIALVEEGMKWYVVTKTTKRNGNFNSLFDGVIYSVFVSLGFAALENIMYVFNSNSFADGFSIAFARFFTSVPGHMFFSVAMGYCYSMWHIFDLAKQCEAAYVSNGIVKQKGLPFDGENWLRRSIIYPTAIHGIWDFLCSERLPSLWLYVFIIFLYIVGFYRIKKLSKADNYDRSIALGLTVKKYPEIREFFAARAAQQTVTPRSVISGEYFNKGENGLR